MNKQQDLKSPWDQDIPKTDYELQPMAPKTLLRVIDILKQQNLSTVKMKFSFANQYQKTLFQDLMKQQQNDEYHRRESGKKKEGIYMEIRKRGQLKKGCYFYIGSRLKSQIFMRAYRQKLYKLQKSQNVKIFQQGLDIYIESEKKVGIGSIVYSQMMQMRKKLKTYIVFNDLGLWETVMNSQLFKKKLSDVGISCFAKLNRFKHVAFYSLDFQPQQIIQQVLKQYSYQPRVLRLEDAQLSERDNLRIFDLLVKSIRSTIEELKQVYEGDLQINKSRSCFVLHLKHKAFEEEPVSLISKVISDLFIMSFSLRRSRTFINSIKRNAKKFPFIVASRYSNIAFCCINRAKIKNKKDLLQIFLPFLQQLQPKSKLTIHLKPNCVLQQNSSMPRMILDLTDQCKVDVDDYQKVIEYEKFNIIVRPKNFNSQVKKITKKVQFGNFLLKLLMLEQKQQQITQDQLNQSILNTGMLQQSVNQQQNRRGNRGKGRQPSNKYAQNNKKQLKKQGSKEQPEKVRGNRGNRGNRGQIQQKTQTKPNKVQYKPKQDQENVWNEDQKKQHSNIMEKSSMLQNKTQMEELQFNYKQPQVLQEDEAFKKSKKEKQIQQIISQKLGIQVKAWKLKANPNIYMISQENNKKLVKQKCYLVKKIEQNGKPPKQLNFINFSSLQNEQYAYIIYKSLDGDFWVPTHMIQRF